MGANDAHIISFVSVWCNVTLRACDYRTSEKTLAKTVLFRAKDDAMRSADPRHRTG